MKTLLMLLKIYVISLILLGTANGQTDSSIIRAITRTYEALEICELQRDSQSATIRDLKIINGYKDSIITIQKEQLDGCILSDSTSTVNHIGTQRDLRKCREEKEQYKHKYLTTLGVAVLEGLLLTTTFTILLSR